jgi:hypothetical protein
MYDKFSNLYKKENNTELKNIYEFLTSYWAISSSLFINNIDI